VTESLNNKVDRPFRELTRQYTELPATVHVLCVGSLLNRAGSFVMIFLSIYVAEQLQLGTQFATRCIGVIGLGSVISSLLGGHLADQFGRRRIMLLALCGGSAMLIAMSQLTSGSAFLLSTFLFALVMEMYRPACAAMIGDVSSVRQRPYAFGLMYIAINLGFAIAPPVGGFLASVDFRWLFWGDAITTISFAVIILLFVSETRPGANRTTMLDSTIPAPVMGIEDVPLDESSASSVSPRSTPPGEQFAEPKEQPETIPLLEAARHIARDSTFLLFCFCNLLTCIVFMQSFSTLPLYMTGLGYTAFEYGALICINGAMIVVLQLPMTHILNRFNRVAMILVGECFLAVGFGLTTFANQTWIFGGTIVLWTCGEIIQAPFKQAIVADLAPASMRARYMGVFSVSYSLGLMIGAPLGGEILVRLGPNWLWPGCFCVTVAAIALYLTLYRRLNDACSQRTVE
jgi:MFS family permease